MRFNYYLWIKKINIYMYIKLRTTVLTPSTGKVPKRRGQDRGSLVSDAEVNLAFFCAVLPDVFLLLLNVLSATYNIMINTSNIIIYIILQYIILILVI